MHGCLGGRHLLFRGCLGGLAHQNASECIKSSRCTSAWMHVHYEILKESVNCLKHTQIVIAPNACAIIGCWVKAEWCVLDMQCCVYVEFRMSSLKWLLSSVFSPSSSSSSNHRKTHLHRIPSQTLSKNEIRERQSNGKHNKKPTGRRSHRKLSLCPEPTEKKLNYAKWREF